MYAASPGNQLLWGALYGTECTLRGKLGAEDVNIKMLSYQYRKSHCRDKTVVRSSYLHHGNSYTGKMSSLYWIRAQVMLLVRWYSLVVNSASWGTSFTNVMNPLSPWVQWFVGDFDHWWKVNIGSGNSHSTDKWHSHIFELTFGELRKDPPVAGTMSV